MESFAVIAPYALVMAAVGLTEGLLTLNLVDEITGTKGNGNRESLAQGAANILNGFFSNGRLPDDRSDAGKPERRRQG